MKHCKRYFYFGNTYNEVSVALNSKDEITPEIHFETTNKKLHDNKYPYQDLYNDPVGMRHTKPMSNYKVNYIADVVEKVRI